MFLFLRGAPKIQNFPISNFDPQLTSDRVINFQFLPNFKNKLLRDGGCQENYGLFPYFGTSFNLKAPLTITQILRAEIYKLFYIEFCLARLYISGNFEILLERVGAGGWGVFKSSNP